MPITIERDGQAALRFEGEMIASASSSDDNAHPDYSGSVGRYVELELYRTTSGKFICRRIGRTRWSGEHDRHEAQACQTDAEVFEFFGANRFAKELYQNAGLDFIETVD